MSSLARYKKAGGFKQLLSLIETFGPQKKEKFLEMIDQENAVWGKALREKMLTLERIFTWPEQVIVEVIKQLQPKTQAFALEGLKDDQKNKVLVFFSASEKRRMQDILTESSPKPEEIQASLVKLVEVARKMITEKELLPEKFDEKLIIPEDYEAKLEQEGSAAVLDNAMAGGSAEIVLPKIPDMKVAAGAAVPGVSAAEIAQLQRSAALLLKENKALKDEVRTLRNKLEQIRKIA